MDYQALPRRQLQALCKEHGLPANATNLEMADALSAIFKTKSDTRKQASKSERASREPPASMDARKAKNLESQEQNALDMSRKSVKQPQRATRSTVCVAEAPTVDISKLEQRASRKLGMKSVSTCSRLGAQGEHGARSDRSKVVTEKVESPDAEGKKDRGGGIVLRRSKVKVRSSRTRSKNLESDRVLEEPELDAEGHEAAQEETTKPHTQSCLAHILETQNRKNKRFVTFSDVLEVTHSFLKSPPTGIAVDKGSSLIGLTADEAEQSSVDTCNVKRANDSKVVTRRASRKNGVQVMAASISYQKKIKGKLSTGEINRDFSMREVDSLGSFAMEKINILNKNCFNPSIIQRSLRGRRMVDDASLVSIEKGKVAENFLKVDSLEEEAPLVPITRRSRRLTLAASDFTTNHMKEDFPVVNEEYKTVESSIVTGREKMGLNDSCSEPCSRQRTTGGERIGEEKDLLPREDVKISDNHLKHHSEQEDPFLSRTRRSRRLTLATSESAFTQEKGKSSATQDEEKNLEIGVSESSGCYSISSTRRSRRLTIAPYYDNVNGAKKKPKAVTSKLESKKPTKAHAIAMKKCVLVLLLKTAYALQDKRARFLVEWPKLFASPIMRTKIGKHSLEQTHQRLSSDAQGNKLRKRPLKFS